LKFNKKNITKTISRIRKKKKSVEFPAMLPAEYPAELPADYRRNVCCGFFFSFSAENAVRKFPADLKTA
jgi:hypothetical protein